MLPVPDLLKITFTSIFSYMWHIILHGPTAPLYHSYGLPYIAPNLYLLLWVLVYLRNQYKILLYHITPLSIYLYVYNNPYACSTRSKLGNCEIYSELCEGIVLQSLI